MMRLKLGSSAMICGFWLFAACGTPNDFESDLQQFFQNATRRDASAVEAMHVVSTGGCAAFFVENAQDRTLLISARHCFNYNINAWCQNNGSLRDNAGRYGSCQRVIASDPNFDIAMFEAKFSYTPTAAQALRLAAFAPAEGTQMKMIGYPGDKYRLGRLTVTENCWILRQSVLSPWKSLLDSSSRHNCTTYAGNSGGPMIWAGTDVALGLPFVYAPDDYDLRDPDRISTSSHMAQIADFVRRKRNILTQAGVVIIDNR